jgi:hypothetical protein
MTPNINVRPAIPENIEENREKLRKIMGGLNKNNEKEQ